MEGGGIGDGAVVTLLAGPRLAGQAAPGHLRLVAQVNTGQHVRVHTDGVGQQQRAARWNGDCGGQGDGKDAGGAVVSAAVAADRRAVDGQAQDSGRHMAHPSRESVGNGNVIGVADTGAGGIGDLDGVGHDVACFDGAAGGRVAGFDQGQGRFDYVHICRISVDVILAVVSIGHAQVIGQAHAALVG